MKIKTNKHSRKPKKIDYDVSVDTLYDIPTIKRLSGIKNEPEGQTTINNGSNISVTADENVRIMHDLNIKPGTPAWFRLWFSRPYLTGEKKT